jgi:hypothetical protein
VNIASRGLLLLMLLLLLLFPPLPQLFVIQQPVSFGIGEGPQESGSKVPCVGGTEDKTTFTAIFNSLSLSPLRTPRVGGTSA